MSAPSVPARTSVELVAALEGVLDAEIQLMNGMLDAFLIQREAVATNDFAVLDDATATIDRLLDHLAQMHGDRQEINRALGATPNVSIQELDQILGQAVSPALRDARERLQMAADRCRRESERNVEILTRAGLMADDQVRTLYGAATPASGGHANAAASPYAQHLSASRNLATGGLLINTTA